VQACGGAAIVGAHRPRLHASLTATGIPLPRRLPPHGPRPQVILATVLRRVEFDTLPGYTAELFQTFTLSTDGGTLVVPRPRGARAVASTAAAAPQAPATAGA
jgi:hypothetical protein